MSKVLKVLSLSFLLCLSLMVAPFHISAEGGSLSAPFVGFNVHILDIDAEYKQIDRGKIYVPGHSANITGQLNCSSWRVTSDNTTPCDIYEFEDQSNSYVNGTHIAFGSMTLDNTTNDQFVGTVYKRIYEIEFVLDGSYMGYVTFFDGGNSYTDYINGTSFKHTFWSDSAESFNITISNYSLYLNNDNSWNFPIESVPFVASFFRMGYKPIMYFPRFSYYYPAFRLNANDTINYFWASDENIYYMVFFIDSSLGPSNIDTFFDFTGFTYTINELNVTNQLFLYNIELKPNTSGNKIIKALKSFRIIPIYFGYNTDILSTDFALQYGLKNPLLRDIDLLANGNVESNQSSSNLDDKTSGLNTSSNQLVTQEDAFNKDMNSALQNVNTDFNFGSNFGSKFIASADWVKTQYDRLTGNTPFGSVISFSLLIGLALLLVGKVFK